MEEKKESKREVKAYVGYNIRQIVNTINSLQLNKEDIVSILSDTQGSYTLLYFG